MLARAVEPDGIRFVFTLKKKRKTGFYYTRSPPKKVERGDPVSEWIVEYLECLKDLCPARTWMNGFSCHRANVS